MNSADLYHWIVYSVDLESVWGLLVNYSRCVTGRLTMVLCIDKLTITDKLMVEIVELTCLFMKSNLYTAPIAVWAYQRVRNGYVSGGIIVEGWYKVSRLSKMQWQRGSDLSTKEMCATGLWEEEENILQCRCRCNNGKMSTKDRLDVSRRDSCVKQSAYQSSWFW